MRCKKLFISIAAMVCLGSSLSMAETNQQTHKTQNSPIVLVKKNKGAVTTRPKSPDLQMITCAYDSKGMELTFAMSEGQSTFIVLDSEKQGGVYTIDTSPLEVYVVVGELTNPIHVQLETERGAVYEGKFEY